MPRARDRGPRSTTAFAYPPHPVLKILTKSHQAFAFGATSMTRDSPAGITRHLGHTAAESTYSSMAFASQAITASTWSTSTRHRQIVTDAIGEHAWSPLPSVPGQAFRRRPHVSGVSMAQGLRRDLIDGKPSGRRHLPRARSSSGGRPIRVDATRRPEFDLLNARQKFLGEERHARRLDVAAG